MKHLVGFWGSVKTRVTLFTLAVFIISLWGLSLYVSRVVRDALAQQTVDQQFSVAVLLAAEVDDQFEQRLQALEKVASLIAPQDMRDPVRLQQQLINRPVFVELFNAGVFVTRTDGVAVASLPEAAQRIGLNYQDRDYLQVALQGRTNVGKPVMGRAVKAPIVAMATPIRDSRGVVVGALAGITNLDAPNFLDKIKNNRFGGKGGYLLLSREHRLIVTATDKRRAMTPVLPAGVSALNDRFMAGFEGSGLNVNSLGEEVLVSGKGVPSTNWLLTINLPTSEAYAPIRLAEQRMRWMTIVLTLLAAALTWWILGRQLAPLVDASAQLSQQSALGLPPKTLHVHRPDEIGTLITAFNTQLATLAEREATLAQSDEFTRMVANNIPGLFAYWTADLRCGFANNGYLEWFGQTAEGIQGMRLQDLMPAYLFAQNEPRIREVLSGIDQSFECELIKGDGTVAQTLIQYKAHRVQGAVVGYFVLITDSSHFKAQEAALQRIANFDPLTGAPNRRLLADRLDQALIRAQRSGRCLAVGFLDLDGFKAVNDRLGHDAGDQLLIGVVENLKKVLRGDDTLARLGGDEFVLLLADMASTEECTLVLQRVLEAAALPVDIDAQAVSVTASIGASIYPYDTADANTLLRHADQAMYTAKQQGKNRFVVFEPPKGV